MAEIEFADLKEMAIHRGYKLQRSRRRLPGGDFGKFGLTDNNGKRVLGFGDPGFTATAADVQRFLHTNVTSTWKQSVKVTPNNKRLAKAKSPEKQNRAFSKTAQEIEDPATILAPKATPVVARKAKLADSEAMAAILNRLERVLVTTTEVRDCLMSFSPKTSGAAVAAGDSIIGIVAWATLPTLHRGIEGRITMLLVEPSHRRAKIGTQLLTFAEKALREMGCDNVEVMSDYDSCNEDFLQSRGYCKTGHGFTRSRPLS